MTTLRIIFSVYIFSFLSFATSAELKKFDHEQYAKNLFDKKPFAISFHASWCPTCRKQEPVLKELLDEKKYEKLLVFKADFDTEKMIKKELMVSRQSTIVVFKDGKEIARETGITDKEKIQTLINQAF